MMAEALCKSNEEPMTVPDIDSDEDSIDELRALGLNDSNLPPENRRRPYEELNDEQRAYHDFHQRIWKRCQEAIAREEERCERMKENTNKEIQEQQPTGEEEEFNELMRKFQKNAQNCIDSITELGKLKQSRFKSNTIKKKFNIHLLRMKICIKKKLDQELTEVLIKEENPKNRKNKIVQSTSRVVLKAKDNNRPESARPLPNVVVSAMRSPAASNVTIRSKKRLIRE